MRKHLRLLALMLACLCRLQAAGVLKCCLRAEPQTLDPLMVSDEAAELIRYLTSGVLIRINRYTQQPEAELAESWAVSSDGRELRFRLRAGLRFSDGSSFGPEDVECTIRRLTDPQLHSPVADGFRVGGQPPVVKILSGREVAIRFAQPLAGFERLFDQLSVVACEDPQGQRAVLGPYFIAERKPGQYIQLSRNPRYWKRDARGRALPYLDGIRLEIQPNRQLEVLKLVRGEIHLIQKLDPDFYPQLENKPGVRVYDAGPGFDAELMWFNQAPQAPIAEHKKNWFRNLAFRRAVSDAISRADLCRIAFGGRATPAAGPVSPANLLWYNRQLRPYPYDPVGAGQRLREAGFQYRGGQLYDATGRPVEFSLITNAGNRSRERAAALIQRDLQKIGMRVQLVTLEFRSLIERITRSLAYEACLLGLTNVDLDPNSQMNLWLSSGANHQWNPKQPKPATAWEAEIDRLMLRQASTLDRALRKAAFDRVQMIVHEQLPFIYLVYRHGLSAYRPVVRNLKPAGLFPELLWNAAELDLEPQSTR